MDPVYNCMQSYPYLNNQMHYWPHNYPGTQPFPAQTYMNPPRPHMNHECWPWGTNYGYAGPVSCHGCVNHSYLPTHCGWRHPNSHVPPVHCPENSHIPVQYMPPHYTMQQPQYEYDKNMHCCGCPNHQCHPKEQKNVKIEEEPDIERRKNDSLVPFQLKNYPYPIVYLPHDFGNDKEHEKLNKSEHKEGENRFLEAKPDENLKDSEQHRNLDRNRQLQDDGKGRFPFPIIWMPYETEEKDKKSHKVNNANQEQSLVPAKGSHAEQNDNVIGQYNGGHASSKLRDIPVKEVKQLEDKENPGIKEKERNVSVKDGNDNAEKKLAKDGSKSSSPKSSKLPPVCLRVDPLPRRKTSNGSSRSPSPPGDKRKLDKLPSNDARKIVTSDNVGLSEITENKIKEDDGITKAIGISDVSPVSTQEEVSTNQTKDKLKEETISLKCSENGELCRAEDVNKDETKPSKIRLTDEEAAVIIQSAYRGFDVRRFAPLKKLKQIANVREQIGDVKNRIQALDMSSDIQYISKKRNIIAELIMSLLLKLDTIQGLHPCVREVRKSVVRELVSLQEKLDSLLNEKSEAAAVHESSMGHDEEASKEHVDITASKNANEAQSELPEPCQHDLNGESNNEMLENSEKIVNGEQMGKNLEMGNVELLESCMDNGTESVIAKEEEQIERVDKDDEISITKKMEDHEDGNGGQSYETSNLQNDSSLETTDFTPTGVCDDSYTSEGINGAQSEEGMSKSDQQPELKIDPTDDENKEHVKLDEAINVEMEDKEMTIDEKMDNKNEDAIFGPTDECSVFAQTPQNVIIADIFEPYEPTSIVAVKDEEESEDSIIAQQRQNVIAAIDDSEEVLGKVEPEQNESYQVANESITDDIEVSNESTHEYNSKHLLPKESVETGNEKNDAFARDELKKANGKLIEENERLRDMMEKLIKSGQEQLASISTLSGKVKDLERKLSRKKKMKVKPYREPRSRLVERYDY